MVPKVTIQSSLIFKGFNKNCSLKIKKKNVSVEIGEEVCDGEIVDNDGNTEKRELKGREMLQYQMSNSKDNKTNKNKTSEVITMCQRLF